MNSGEPAFGYMRCSGQGQVDGDTWERQEAAIERYCGASGLNMLHYFRDEGVSGKTELIGREGLTSLLVRCQERDIKTVVIESSDRLARDMIVAELLIQEFQKIGVRVIAANGGIDLTEGDDSNPTAKLIRQILSAIAEFDRNSTVIKLRVARERARSKNGRCEGRKPYGHYPDELTGLIMMKDIYQKGWSLSFIATFLNESNVKTRSGKPWRAPTVAKILAREKISRTCAKLAQKPN